jgi:hypothetical protein
MILFYYVFVITYQYGVLRRKTDSKHAKSLMVEDVMFALSLRVWQPWVRAINCFSHVRLVCAM